MATCSFCGIDIVMGTGKIFVKKDGKVLNFCSRKCEKNMIQLGRKPRETLWTKEGYATQKDAAKQSTKAKS